MWYDTGKGVSHMTAEEQRTVDHAARSLLMAAAEQKGAQRVLDTAYGLLELPILLNDQVFHPIDRMGPDGFQSLKHI